MNNRRKLVIAMGAGALTVPLACFAQQAPATVRRIGVLSPLSPADTALWYEALRVRLRELGWVEGKNISIEYRHAEGKSDRLADLATDLVSLKVDVIVASTSSDALAARKATTAIPIVVIAASNPVASGLVASLAHPGGNVTGIYHMSTELVGKRLELLKEIVPKLSRVAVVRNPQDPNATLNWNEISLAARPLGIELHSLEVRSANELDNAFDAATKARADALFTIQNNLFVANMKRIVDFAAKSRLPSIFFISEYADAGGLVAYGEDRADAFRRAAAFVDKILKGTKPGDLPIDAATKFELVINAKPAKAIGIKIPQSVLLRADRVIQ